MLNEPVLLLDQNTAIVLGGVRESRSLIEMLRGALYFFSRELRRLEMRTPFVNAGVVGTRDWSRQGLTKTLMTIFHGSIRAENPSGMLLLSGGQSAVSFRRNPLLQSYIT